MTRLHRILRLPHYTFVSTLMSTYLSTNYDCIPHDHTIMPGGQRILHDSSVPIRVSSSLLPHIDLFHLRIDRCVNGVRWFGHMRRVLSSYVHTSYCSDPAGGCQGLHYTEKNTPCVQTGYLPTYTPTDHLHSPYSLT